MEKTISSGQFSIKEGKKYLSSEENAEYTNRHLSVIVWGSIQPVSLTLGIIFFVFTFVHLFLSAPDIKYIMSVLSGLTALIFFGISSSVKSLPFLKAYPDFVAFAIASLIIANVLTHIFLSGDILQTTNIILVVVGSGALILSTRWLLITYGTAAIAWVLIVSSIPQEQGVIHFAFALSLGVIISYIVQRIRIRSIQRSEKAHEVSELQKEALNQALLVTKASQERIQAILNTAVNGIITIDTQGVIESFNPAAESIFGFKKEEVIGKNVGILMPEPDKIMHHKYIQRYMETGEARIIGIGREVEGRRKNGETFPMDIAVSEVQLPDKKIFTGIIADNTKKRQAEETLRQAREKILELKVVIDRQKLREEVSEITGSEFFQNLKKISKTMRRKYATQEGKRRDNGQE